MASTALGHHNDEMVQWSEIEQDASDFALSEVP
jgi:hypothetical protein